MRSFFLIIIAVITAIVAINGLFVVQETQQAMVLTLGKIDRVVAIPGLDFKIPFYQQVLLFDKRVLETDSLPEEVQTIDKKRVVVDSFTRWRIVDAEKFYKAVRNEFSAIQRLNTIVNSNIRNVVARESLQELVSGDRQRLMSEIQSESSVQAKPLGIEIVDVRIKRADLPEANASAVFQRMRTEREKEAKEIRASGDEEAQKIRANANRQRTILLAEADRDAQKLRGEGDGQSIKITGIAFNKDKVFYGFIRSLEAYRGALREGTTIVLDSSLEFMEIFKGK